MSWSTNLYCFFPMIFLVYCPSLHSHVEHPRQTLMLLWVHHLFVNNSKCQLAKSELDYLVPFIFATWILADLLKIQGIQQWPVPKMIKALCGFLGLTGYFCRIVCNYGIIAKPLPVLLQEYNFYWDDKAVTTFEKLKQAMIQLSTLALLDFSKPFIVESHTCHFGVGAVLLQGT